MLNNKKGAALMQVLLVTAVLAGLATMLLRSSLSRTTAARQTRQSVSFELLVEACQAEINMMWSQKTSAVFKRDLSGCWMNCSATIAEDKEQGWDGKDYTTSKCYSSNPKDNQTNLTHATRYYMCHVPVNGGTVDIKAQFSEPTDDNGPCKLTFPIDQDEVDQL